MASDRKDKPASQLASQLIIQLTIQLISQPIIHSVNVNQVISQTVGTSGIFSLPYLVCSLRGHGRQY